ncbi:acetyltransferase, gnat family [Ilyonectria robusta]|uniref:acetyltransferase, gnat family n=1 Tax=Ilyonectria robusta TaxID=1079257 RepID=UPI001E8CEA35|nr:acetyltransferase, gnat family [Ilyonectria robusta]KAH8654817.1 acetyltransferase, gnat family [Ilyonectria robusta]
MESRPGNSISPSQLAAIFNEAFTNYIGTEVQFTEETITLWCNGYLVSLELSHIFFPTPDSNEPVAFGLIAIRDDKPKESRLAAMGVVPSYHGKGTGTQVMELIISAERKRGVHIIELECIKQNERALRLYKRMGFSIEQELYGWEKDLTSVKDSVSNTGIEDCTFDELEKQITKHAAPTLPWQAWGWGVSPLGPTKRVFKLGHAYCGISHPDKDDEITVNLTSIFVEPEWRRQGEARRLMEAVMAKFPGKKWRAGVVFPKEPADRLAAHFGFTPMDLSQYQMRLQLV